jgi:hypothetical protein
MGASRRAIVLIVVAVTLLLLPYWQQSSPRLSLSTTDSSTAGSAQFDAVAFASDLYSRYGQEISKIVPIAKAFCKKSGVQCLSNDLETEMLVLWLRA